MMVQINKCWETVVAYVSRWKSNFNDSQAFSDRSLKFKISWLVPVIKIPSVGPHNVTINPVTPLHCVILVVKLSECENFQDGRLLVARNLFLCKMHRYNIVEGSISVLFCSKSLFLFRRCMFQVTSTQLWHGEVLTGGVKAHHQHLHHAGW